jgi:hypothetical protein
MDPCCTDIKHNYMYAFSMDQGRCAADIDGAWHQVGRRDSENPEGETPHDLPFARAVRWYGWAIRSVYNRTHAGTRGCGFRGAAKAGSIRRREEGRILNRVLWINTKIQPYQGR